MTENLDFSKDDVSTDAFRFRRGTYNFFGQKQSDFGFTVIIEGYMGSTHVNLADEEEAIQTCLNAEERWEVTKDLRESTNRYLSSPEGAWGAVELKI